MSNIGEKIKQYRKKNGLSQRALSRQIGIEHSLIARYENGQRNPSMRSNKVICDIIGIDPITLEPIKLPERSAWDDFPIPTKDKSVMSPNDYLIWVSKYIEELKQIPAKEDEI
jgi:transcriptional regulator with XRE-family HTH domain